MLDRVQSVLGGAGCSFLLALLFGAGHGQLLLALLLAGVLLGLGLLALLGLGITATGGLGALAAGGLALGAFGLGLLVGGAGAALGRCGGTEQEQGAEEENVLHDFVCCNKDRNLRFVQLFKEPKLEINVV